MTSYSDAIRAGDVADFCELIIRKSVGDLAVRWIDIPTNPNYAVSDSGQVRNNRNGVSLKGTLDRDGYLRICLGGKTLKVHRLVCQAFHGPQPAGHEVGHTDGNKLNNAAANLRWVTRSENIKDQVRHGTHRGVANLVYDGRPGELNPYAKLTNKTAAEIRDAVGKSTRAIAREYGISQPTVVQIRKGQRWVRALSEAPEPVKPSPPSAPSHIAEDKS
jgi:hypothetical protein